MCPGSWYDVKADCEHDFPNHIRLVLTADASDSSSDRIWMTGMNVTDVIGRLLGETDNNSHDNLFDVVETATKMFADLKRRFQLNQHHVDVLRKS